MGFGGKSLLEEEEEDYLLGMLGEVVHIFDTLLDSLGFPGLLEHCNLSGSWHEQRRAVHKGLGVFESGIDRALLATHLLHPATVAPEGSLVTPKTSVLVHAAAPGI